MKLIKITICEEQLERLFDNEEEKYFFLQMLHFLNDINIFQKLIVYTAKEHENKTLEKVQTLFTSSVVFILAGKLKEGWKVVFQKFYKTNTVENKGEKKEKLVETAFAKDIFSKLNVKETKSLNLIKEYFDKKDPETNKRNNLIETVRHEYTFHYGSKHLEEGFKKITNKELEIFFPNYPGGVVSNSSFLILESLFKKVAPEDENPFDALYKGVLDISEAFKDFLFGYIGIYLKSYIDEDKFVEEEVPDPPNLEDNKIPFFVVVPDKYSK